MFKDSQQITRKYEHRNEKYTTVTSVISEHVKIYLNKLIEFLNNK